MCLLVISQCPVLLKSGVCDGLENISSCVNYEILRHHVRCTTLNWTKLKCSSLVWAFNTQTPISQLITGLRNSPIGTKHSAHQRVLLVKNQVSLYLCHVNPGAVRKVQIHKIAEVFLVVCIYLHDNEAPWTSESFLPETLCCYSVPWKY